MLQIECVSIFDMLKIGFGPSGSHTLGRLVQVPCIERNSMGAIKVINAAGLALHSDPKNPKVSLDKVIQTMCETAKDMDSKYKETSEDGLAVGAYPSDC